MRLSAPTRKTFALSFLAIAAGIAIWFAPLRLPGSATLAFLLTAAGAVLLLLGNLLNRL